MPNLMPMVYPRVRSAVSAGKVKVVVLAGGQGERLGPITRPSVNRSALPKPLVNLGQIPLINFSLEPIKALGIKDIHITTCYLSEEIEKRIVQNPIYGISMDPHREDPDKPLDTAGAVNYVFNMHQWGQDRDATVIVLSADIAHNMDIGPMLNFHLENKAAATIVLNDVPWTDVNRFGTVRLDDMPRREQYRTMEEFEDAVGAYLMANRGGAKKIAEFKEKASREAALSNLNNSSIYFFNAGFLADLSSLITPKDRGDKKPPYRSLSDYGKHIFPALTGRADHISRNYPHYPKFLELVDKVKQGEYGFFGAVWPEKNPWGKPSYWKDLGTPLALWEANIKDVLGGRLYTWLGPAKGIWWPTEYGWVGNHVSIGKNVKISRSPLEEQSTPHRPIGAIIGHYVTIEDGVKIKNSIIGDRVVLKEGVEVENSIICGGDQESATIITGGLKVINSIVLGGKYPTNYAQLASIQHGLAYRLPIIDLARDFGGLVVDPMFRE